MMLLILLTFNLLCQQGDVDKARPEGWSQETIWGWEGNGVNVLLKYFDSASKKYFRCEMYKDEKQIVLSHADLKYGSAPTQVQFCAKDETSFAFFSYDDARGGIALHEYSIAEKKQLKIPFDAGETLNNPMPNGRGNSGFYPILMLKQYYRPNFGAVPPERKPGIDVEMEMTSVAREGDRWLVTMKIGKVEYVFYRADRESFWHLQMDDENDWLADEPVLCGSAQIRIDGEEKTVQLWNQIAVRQNVEQQLVTYKIPDINFTWVDVVNADGSTRRIWDAPEDELTLGTNVNSGFIACYDNFKNQIVFAFQDQFHAVEYYQVSAGQNLPKSDVLSRTQSYIQRADGRGSRSGMHWNSHRSKTIAELSRISMAEEVNGRLQLLKFQPLADQMQLEVSVNGKTLVLVRKDGGKNWEFRLNLPRPIDGKDGQ